MKRALILLLLLISAAAWWAVSRQVHTPQPELSQSLEAAAYPADLKQRLSRVVGVSLQPDVP